MENEEKKLTLDEYLYTYRITLNEFSRNIRYNPIYVCAVKNGKRPPSKRLRFIVEKQTKGQVVL